MLELPDLDGFAQIGHRLYHSLALCICSLYLVLSVYGWLWLITVGLFSLACVPVYVHTSYEVGSSIHTSYEIRSSVGILL